MVVRCEGYSYDKLRPSKCYKCGGAWVDEKGEVESHWGDVTVKVSDAEYSQCKDCGLVIFSLTEAVRLQQIAIKASYVEEDNTWLLP
jgi:hypothetical protein